jgi:TRAP-type C4-dicarboxylate transport system substrate-binding protein
MDKRAFDSYPADIQCVLLELGKKYTRQMIERSRADNARAVGLMKQKGLQEVSLEPGEMRRLDDQTRQIWTNLQGKLYAPELLNQVQAAALSARTPKGARP